MAFYAAVHIVNAYLWETRQFEPRNHQERWQAVRSDRRLGWCREAYRTLRDIGYHARYTETFSVTEQEARELLDVDYRRVEATVMQALGQPAPVW